MIAAGGTNAEGLADEGPSWYYNGLAVVGFLVASLLFFNSLFMLGRGIRAYKEKHGGNVFGATLGMLVNRASSFGGFLSHLAMAVILVGLIGSSMYVTEKVAYVNYDEAADTAEDFTIQDFTLKYTSNDITEMENGDDILYTVNYDVYKDGQFVGSVSPAVQLVQSTQQQKLVAGVISFPTEDLFVVYKGVNKDGDFSMDVRVNPLIAEVWIGFGLLMVGVVVATLGRRGAKRKSDDSTSETASGVGNVQSLKQSSQSCGTRLVDAADPARSEGASEDGACEDGGKNLTDEKKA